MSNWRKKNKNCLQLEDCVCLESDARSTHNNIGVFQDSELFWLKKEMFVIPVSYIFVDRRNAMLQLDKRRLQSGKNPVSKFSVKEMLNRVDAGIFQKLTTPSFSWKSTDTAPWNIFKYRGRHETNSVKEKWGGPSFRLVLRLLTLFTERSITRCVSAGRNTLVDAALKRSWRLQCTFILTDCRADIRNDVQNIMCS